MMVITKIIINGAPYASFHPPIVFPCTPPPGEEGVCDETETDGFLKDSQGSRDIYTQYLMTRHRRSGRGSMWSQSRHASWMKTGPEERMETWLDRIKRQKELRAGWVENTGRKGSSTQPSKTADYLYCKQVRGKVKYSHYFSILFTEIWIMKSLSYEGGKRIQAKM